MLLVFVPTCPGAPCASLAQSSGSEPDAPPTPKQACVADEGREVVSGILGGAHIRG